jgi:uncharacterized protein
MDLIEDKKNFIYFIFFFLLLFTLGNYYTYYYLDTSSIKSVFIASLVYLFVWDVPVFLYLKYVYKKNVLKFLKLDKQILKNISVGVVYGFLLMSPKLLLNSMIDVEPGNQGLISMGFDTFLNTIILVGIFEEVVFRGFILHKLLEYYSFKVANITTSIFFALMHIPTIINDSMPSIVAVQNLVYIFLISFLLGIVVKSRKSLWCAISMHSAHNFIMVVFF